MLVHETCLSGCNDPLVSKIRAEAACAQDFSHFSSSSASSASDIASEQQPIPAFIHPGILIPAIGLVMGALEDPSTWRTIHIANRFLRSRRTAGRQRRRQYRDRRGFSDTATRPAPSAVALSLLAEARGPKTPPGLPTRTRARSPVKIAVSPPALGRIW